VRQRDDSNAASRRALRRRLERRRSRLIRVPGPVASPARL